MQLSLSKKLQDKLDNLPRRPGVYLFQNTSGTVIYIGKAKVLRNRVRSYFQASGASASYSKTKALVKRIADLDYIVTDTEKEALILEANLVKEHNPRYNVDLKDDKSFPYIRITNDLYPRVFTTRKKVLDGSEYFGPYTEVKPMRAVIRTLRKIFQVRTCRYNLTAETVEKKKYKLCLEYHIKRCGGPCEDLVSAEEYNAMIDQIRSFLQGHTSGIAALLQEKMTEAAERMAFEDAAMYRDRLREVEKFRSKQKVVDTKPVDRDIVAVAYQEDLACGVIFKEREGKIIGRRSHAMERTGDLKAAEIMRSFIMQTYLTEEFIPPEIFVSNSVEDREAITEWLSDKRGSKVRIVVPKKGDKAKLTEMCLKNAKLLLGEIALQMQQKKDYIAFSVQALKKDLNLKELPMVVEAFDISNIHGKDAVASLVVFHNGAAKKSEYRVFKIRSKDTADDFAMMAEAVERRYTRLKKEKTKLPDLILVDGGKGQLSSAVAALEKAGTPHIPIAGLAKRLDEAFLPGISEPYNIPRTSAGLKLLQRIRDEAHRFAITHHRKQRKKRTIASELDEIPGIGPERKRLLLKYFGSLAKLKNAAPESIAQVRSISESMAQAIYDYFHK